MKLPDPNSKRQKRKAAQAARRAALMNSSQTPDTAFTPLDSRTLVEIARELRLAKKLDGEAREAALRRLAERDRQNEGYYSALSL